MKDSHFFRRLVALSLVCVLVAHGSFVSAQELGSIQTSVVLAPPSGVVIEMTANGPRVSWTPSGHEAAGSVEAYKIYYKLASDDDYDPAVFETVYVGAGSSFTFDPEGLIAGEAYDFRVTAVDNHGTESEVACLDCQVAGFTPTEVEPPAEPEPAPIASSGNAQQQFITPEILANNARPESTPNFADGVRVATYSRNHGSATLAGEARDADGYITRVELRIQDDETMQYWNGNSWQAGVAVVQATALDGAFDTGFERWHYLGLPSMRAGATYRITSIAYDNYDAVETQPVTRTITFDPGTIQSSIDLTADAIVSSLSPISGTASVSSGTLTAVEVRITRLSDAVIFQGSGWGASEKWLPATLDGSTWTFSGFGENHQTVNERYEIAVRGKTSTQTQASPTTVTVRYDPSKPEIAWIRAGASASTRSGIEDGAMVNFAATGNDGLVSFSWHDPASASGDAFFYTIDQNPAPTSIQTENDGHYRSTPYVDQISLTPGWNYLHVRAQNGNGIWGEERVFGVQYDGVFPRIAEVRSSAAAGAYTIGNTIPLTLHFSEPVRIPHAATLHLNTGAAIAIPPSSNLINSLTVDYTIGTWDTGSTLAVLLLEGAVIDAAGNASINPTPLLPLSARKTFEIQGAKIELLDLAPDEAGVFATTHDLIRLRVLAPAASEMLVRTSGLKNDARNSVTLGSWIAREDGELSLVLDDTQGPRFVTVDIRDQSGNNAILRVLVSRTLSTEDALLAEERAEERLSLSAEELREAARSVLPSSVNIDDIHPTLLADLFRAIASGDEAAITAARDALMTLIANMQSLRDLLAADEIDSLLPNLLTLLETRGMQLVHIFSLHEIQTLIARLNPNDRELLRPYLLGLAIDMRDDETLDIKQQDLGQIDSDGDGLSDWLEIYVYGTNPYLADTDGDGFLDGEEVLDYGTDPLVFNERPEPRIVNVRDGDILQSAMPVLKGAAMFSAEVEIMAIAASNGALIPLGTTRADSTGKWLLVPKSALPRGDYTLQLRDTDGTVLHAIRVTIDLSFTLPPPDVVATSGTTEVFQASILSLEGLLVFGDDQPVFYGNTYYGSTVVAVFQSIMMSTAVIADNPEGDFEVRPPRPLPIGRHTLTLYAELPDGSRSDPRVIHFSVDPARAEQLRLEAASPNIISLRNIILLFLVVNLGITLWRLGAVQWEQRREQTAELRKN